MAQSSEFLVWRLKRKEDVVRSFKMPVDVVGRQE